MILMMAEETDIHALSVARACIERKPSVKIVIFDSQQFPSKASLTFDLVEWVLERPNAEVVRSTEVEAVWWRRTPAHNINKSVRDPTARNFCSNESSHAFRTIASWPGYSVYNNAERERIATSKPLQHRLALETGFAVPETIVTNDPGRVEEFFNDHQRVIYKVMTSPISSFAETRRLKREDLELLASLSHAPVIFQREIEKKRDIRVTVVGKNVFAATVRGTLPRGSTIPDWRVDATAECQAIDLDRHMIAKILSITEALGLDYAALDFIEDVDGTIYFSEVNPSGQFLFVEIDTLQPISAAIADLLLRA